MGTIAQIDRPAPGFSLPDPSGRMHALDDAHGQLLILNFWSAECPWTKRVDAKLVKLMRCWKERVLLWPIVSNAGEDAQQAQKVAEERGLPFVLLDEDHRAADRYGAQTTPHFFVIDPGGTLRYKGSLDDTTFRQRAPTRPYLDQAIRALLTGARPDPAETPAYGCAIVRHRIEKQTEG